MKSVWQAQGLLGTQLMAVTQTWVENYLTKNHYYSIDLERKMHILFQECLHKGNNLHQLFFRKKK